MTVTLDAGILTKMVVIYAQRLLALRYRRVPLARACLAPVPPRPCLPSRRARIPAPPPPVPGEVVRVDQRCFATSVTGGPGSPPPRPFSARSYASIRSVSHIGYI
jgi:hypothetical protein